MRPSTDPDVFAYLAPLIRQSLEAIEALPPDGPHDPKILMRVDWGTGEPLLPCPISTNADEPAGGGDGGGDGGGNGGGDGSTVGNGGGGVRGGGDFLKRALVKRAGSLAAPQKKLKRSMDMHGTAPLAGANAHFINEVEIHPGYYVDWDATPDLTLDALGKAYGEYIMRLLEERRAAAEAHP